MCGLARHCSVRAVTDALKRFGESWLPRLNSGARTVLEHAPSSGKMGLHTAIADKFVTGLGYSGIAFNWELLDASADATGARSAFAEITNALTNDISSYGQPWLEQEEAQRCAHEFLDAFDPATRTFVSNRYDGLWNPIAGKPVEWGFVGFDDTVIALLLITEP